jgi:hypothetical protein
MNLRVIFDVILLLFIAEKMKKDYQYSDNIELNFYLIIISLMKLRMHFIILDSISNVILKINK